MGAVPPIHVATAPYNRLHYGCLPAGGCEVTLQALGTVVASTFNACSATTDREQLNQLLAGTNSKTRRHSESVEYLQPRRVR